MDPPRTRMCPRPFFGATPPGAAPGPPIKTGARVRHFRGVINKNPFPVDDHKKITGTGPITCSEGEDPPLRLCYYVYSKAHYLGMATVQLEKQWQNT